jgi:hypothetical protein
MGMGYWVCSAALEGGQGVLRGPVYCVACSGDLSSSDDFAVPSRQTPFRGG